MDRGQPTLPLGTLVLAPDVNPLGELLSGLHKRIRVVAVPVIIFAACFVAGSVAGTLWLPSLAAGATGGLAFFAVCGLLGAGLGVIGLHLYVVVELIESSGLGKTVVADQLSDMLFQAGVVLGLGTAIYLLAPRSPAKAHETAD
jgi:hypothetical protein